MSGNSLVDNRPVITSIERISIFLYAAITVDTTVDRNSAARGYRITCLSNLTYVHIINIIRLVRSIRPMIKAYIPCGLTVQIGAIESIGDRCD